MSWDRAREGGREETRREGKGNWTMRRARRPLRQTAGPRGAAWRRSMSPIRSFPEYPPFQVARQTWSLRAFRRPPAPPCSAERPAARRPPLLVPSILGLRFVSSSSAFAFPVAPPDTCPLNLDLPSASVALLVPLPRCPSACPIDRIFHFRRCHEPDLNVLVRPAACDSLERWSRIGGAFCPLRMHRPSTRSSADSSTSIFLRIHIFR